jgi:predicted nucleic acid-binding OB-fold protein
MENSKSFQYRKIRVTYPDGKNEHFTSFDEIRERFKGEREEWLQNFIAKIIMTGYAYTNFGGKYEMTEEEYRRPVK